jgi:hypothetical protein
MGFFSRITRAGSAGVRAAAGAATGAAGKITPGVPRVVSGAVGKAIPSAMRAAPQPLGLVQRFAVARGVSGAVAKAEMAAGRTVGINPSFRFARPTRARRFW